MTVSTLCRPTIAALQAARFSALCLAVAPLQPNLRAEEADAAPAATVRQNPADDGKSPATERALTALEILPLGEKSHGVVLPDYDLQGNLLSMLKAEGATRVTETEIELDAMTLTLSQRAPRTDLLIALPVARYDLRSFMLFGLRDIRISRDDFTLTGDTLEFDTRTRRGILRGNIKMILKKRLDAPALDSPQTTSTIATPEP